MNPSEKNSTAESIEARANDYKKRFERVEAKKAARAKPEFERQSNDVYVEDGAEDDIPPETEMQAFIWEVLLWRDELVRGIVDAIENIPGLTTMLEQITTVINQCMYAPGFPVPLRFH